LDWETSKSLRTIRLTVPLEWEVVSNGQIVNQSLEVEKGVRISEFSETEPLPTYLFSFVTGKLQKITEEREGRSVTLYHRESDEQKQLQCKTILDEVFGALKWMEEYTSIKYPFTKYDLIILPGFQYGGMEHAGATLYNDKRMFLSEHPTPDEELGRTELIAHETAHMWFGDLVTMKWFNDVWTKEVFANYLAAKIVEQQFPDVNHKLNFLKSYQIYALAEDRTDGTHAIQQQLDNLQNAGLMYGNIIYDKAPVMMRKMEQQMGAEAFQRGIQKYLKKYAFDNPTWDDLIDILDRERPQANLHMQTCRPMIDNV
jgi:aminopeptidase N